MGFTGSRILGIIIGIVFIVGGAAGVLVLRGTNSGGALAVVGVILIIYNIYKALSTK